MTSHFLRIDDVELWEHQIRNLKDVLDFAGRNTVPLVLGVIAGRLDRRTARVLRASSGFCDIALHGVTHDLMEFWRSGRSRINLPPSRTASGCCKMRSV